MSLHRMRREHRCLWFGNQGHRPSFALIFRRYQGPSETLPVRWTGGFWAEMDRVTSRRKIMPLPSSTSSKLHDISVVALQSPTEERNGSSTGITLQAGSPSALQRQTGRLRGPQHPRRSPVPLRPASWSTAPSHQAPRRSRQQVAGQSPVTNLPGGAAGHYAPAGARNRPRSASRWLLPG